MTLESTLNKFKSQVRTQGIPGFLIKQLATIESVQISHTNKSKTDKDFSQNNFSSSNWRSVNTVGNKLKKFLDNKMKDQIKKYNEVIKKIFFFSFATPKNIIIPTNIKNLFFYCDL